MHVTLRNKKNIGLICFMLVSSSYFGLLCRTTTLLGQKNLIIKSSCVNQIYNFWAIENILEFTCVTLYVPYHPVSWPNSSVTLLVSNAPLKKWRFLSGLDIWFLPFKIQGGIYFALETKLKTKKK